MSKKLGVSRQLDQQEIAESAGPEARQSGEVLNTSTWRSPTTIDADRVKALGRQALSKSMSLGRQAALSVLRSEPVSAASRRLTPDRLRILGYHGVYDVDIFAQHMEFVAANYVPVTEDEVIAWTKGQSLPNGAVWVTFDDGDPTVVRNGLPILERLGMSATMYVCPGLIESGDPFWWRVTEWATEHHPAEAAAFGGPQGLTEHVKTIPDAERRQAVESLSGLLDGEVPSDWIALTRDDLALWFKAGMTVGNHSWDHPCLDRCSEDEQRRQVGRAHEWLTETLGHAPRTFAYPNGNFSQTVDAEVAALGYEAAVLYDNRLTARGSDPRQLSRLMMESDQAPERLAGVLSGIQPAIRSLVHRG